MEEEKKPIEETEGQDVLPREKAILELVRLSDEEQKQAEQQAKTEAEQSNDAAVKKEKVFKKYMIKDIVFLAIITACTLVTGAIMPLLVNVPPPGAGWPCG